MEINPRTSSSYRACTTFDGQPCPKCREKNSLECYILEMKKLLAEHEGKLLDVRHELNKTHPSIVDRCPQELASLIFEFYASDGDEDLGSPFLFSRNCRNLVLGHICRKWRAIAWNTPQLWNVVCVKPRSLAPHLCNVTMLEEWLDRSKRLPLTIYLWIPSNIYKRPEDVKSWYACFELINQCSSRWLNLKVEIPSDFICRLSGDGLSSPAMKNLCFIPSDRNYRTGIDTHTRDATFVLKNARPSPKIVQIHSFRLRSLDIDWSNVTYLSAGTLYFEEYLEILRQANQLEKCVFYSVFATDGALPITPSLITLPFLREFETIHDPGLSLKALLDCLVLPSLVNYSCRLLSGGSIKLRAASLVSLIDRSSCSPKELQLYGRKHDYGTLAESLKYSPEARMPLRFY